MLRCLIDTKQAVESYIRKMAIQLVIKKTEQVTVKKVLIHSCMILRATGSQIKFYIKVLSISSSSSASKMAHSEKRGRITLSQMMIFWTEISRRIRIRCNRGVTNVIFSHVGRKTMIFFVFGTFSHSNPHQ